MTTEQNNLRTLMSLMDKKCSELYGKAIRNQTTGKEIKDFNPNWISFSRGEIYAYKKVMKFITTIYPHLELKND